MRRFLSWAMSLATAYLVFSTALPLLAEDLGYLKYFTVLSNLWMGIAAAIYCVALPLAAFEVIEYVPTWVNRLKYVGATLTLLTFVTVACYLGPKNDFATAYVDANLYLHMIVPLLALLDFGAFDREDEVILPETLLCLPPILAYDVFYIGNLLLNGYGGRDHPNDWYGFAETSPTGAYVAATALLFVGWLAALLLGSLHNGEWKIREDE